MERRTIKEKLEFLYPDKTEYAFSKVSEVMHKYQKLNYPTKPFVNEQDVMLITYGDSIKKQGENPLATLNEFLTTYAQDTVSAVHLLPMFPFTSDDGFSVVDYREINTELGTWDDVRNLSQNFDLMFDAVINHSSKSCSWFEEFLNGNDTYAEYYICADPTEDYSKVTRPRALPLLTEFDTANGKKYLWTTFSDDQIDLNFQNPDVLAEIIDIMLFYAFNGARFIRLDAIGFAWKKLGTTCMHLEETHEIVKVIRLAMDECAKGCTLITETNVPHIDNISYFGNGLDEAQLVYQFPLPPLTLFSYHTQNATKLSEWAKGIGNTSESTTFFNFLASHDGIGMRPVEGILTEQEKQILVDKCIEHGGLVSYKDNGDGTKSPYELNVNYQDALTNPNESDDVRMKRLLGSQVILLTLAGMPGIYVHSFLGSRGDKEGAKTSGINRRINREKLDYDQLVSEITSDTNRKRIFDSYCEIIRIRRSNPAFSPMAKQEILDLDSRVFAVRRTNEDASNEVVALINVSKDNVEISMDICGVDLISGKEIDGNICLAPYEYCWIKNN